ncbi:hypothetical protein BYT27DRAFT_7254796 [Phlegmacium glaucopus]|nr:hypothetical protein BYT27DRAFT_7254796 [Phlegmacium glaucopus]
MSSQINFAKALGIESLAGAIVFTILYIPILVWFVRKSFNHPTQVHYALTFFCTIRVVAFVMRAVLAGSASAGESIKVLIADEALFAIGYFSLLYSAYSLVLDRILLSNESSTPSHPILRLTQNRRVFRLAIMIALILGIVSSSTTTSNGTSTTNTSLHIASTVIFLIVTALQAIQTIILASQGVSARSQYFVRGEGTIGVRYGNYILVIISLLLLVREAFATATVKNSAKQNNEHFWYPLLAVPEILAVILFTTPGLVPRQDEVPAYSLTDKTAAEV